MLTLILLLLLLLLSLLLLSPISLLCQIKT